MSQTMQTETSTFCSPTCPTSICKEKPSIPSKILENEEIKKENTILRLLKQLFIKKKLEENEGKWNFMKKTNKTQLKKNEIEILLFGDLFKSYNVYPFIRNKQCYSILWKWKETIYYFSIYRKSSFALTAEDYLFSDQPIESIIIDRTIEIIDVSTLNSPYAFEIVQRNKRRKYTLSNENEMKKHSLLDRTMIKETTEKHRLWIESIDKIICEHKKTTGGDEKKHESLNEEDVEDVKYLRKIEQRIPRHEEKIVECEGQKFSVYKHYTLMKSIGIGAYGAVIAVQNEKTRKTVAIKKITDVFEDLVDAKRILREIRLLRHFSHPNILRLIDLPLPLSRRHFIDMYIVTDLMETDLHQIIYSSQTLSTDHIKYFLYQALCALYHMHSAGVIHRDIKPSNILLNANCDLKICDFGLARGGIEAATELTEYVVTRWYRAPEIMLGCINYNTSVDIWALGCIVVEMFYREPLFPGNDYIDQLKLILRFLGTPKQEDIKHITNAKALRFLCRQSICRGNVLEDVFHTTIEPEGIDLIKQMLTFNPEKRITAEKALQHPYLSTFYDPKDIYKALPFNFEFDLPNEKLTRNKLMDLFYEDIYAFHPPIPDAM